MTPDTQPECIYCSQTAEHCGELRLDNGFAVECGYETPEYVCRECFDKMHDGPSFDDLPGVKS